MSAQHIFFIGLGWTQPSHFGLGQNWSGPINGVETLHCSRKTVEQLKEKKKEGRGGGELT